MPVTFADHFLFTSVARNVLEMRGTRQKMTVTLILSIVSPSQSAVGQAWDRVGQDGEMWNAEWIKGADQQG